MISATSSRQTLNWPDFVQPGSIFSLQFNDIPLWEANIKAVVLLMFATFTSAPPSISNFTISECPKKIWNALITLTHINNTVRLYSIPFEAAYIIAMFLNLFSTLTSAFFSINNFTNSNWCPRNWEYGYLLLRNITIIILILLRIVSLVITILFNYKIIIIILLINIIC